MTETKKAAKTQKSAKKAKRFFITFGVVFILLSLLSVTVFATDIPGVSLNIGGNSSADTLKIVLMLTVLSLAPAILIMMTGFTRIIIVLSFVKNALGLQQTPPNQVMVGLALFLTLFVMSPIFSQINKEAYVPYTENKITQKEFISRAMTPLREFMLKQTKADDLNLFLGLAKVAKPENTKDIPTQVIIPAFITSELKRAFIIGFLIFIPFLIIDMIVSSTLMSLGMMMLPPTMISLPFKVLLFILVDGWGLTVKTLITSFS